LDYVLDNHDPETWEEVFGHPNWYTTMNDTLDILPPLKGRKILICK
jgi:hypothetical protein